MLRALIWNLLGSYSKFIADKIQLQVKGIFMFVTSKDLIMFLHTVRLAPRLMFIFKLIKRDNPTLFYHQSCLFTCIALASAGLVVGPLRPSVCLSVRPQHFRVPSLCNL